MSDSAQQHINFGSKRISFDLSFEERKSLGIRVFPDGRVNVKAPLDTALDKVFWKLKKKAHWIIKQQDFFQSFNPLTPARKYINGETHLYLGRQYRLKIIQSEIKKVNLSAGFLQVYLPEPFTNTVHNLLNKWYREKADLQFHNVLKALKIKFDKYKIIEPAITIRSMQKRWGSCTVTGKIILNPDLVKAPKGSIEYVITHELCHLVYRRHNKAFYDLQSTIMPEWKKWKEKLEYYLA